MIDNLINILWLAKSEYPLGSNLVPHSHSDYYQIYYVISGEGDFIVDEERVTLDKGMYLFTRPGHIHGIADTREFDGQPLRMLEAKYVVFDKEFQESLDQIPMVCHGSYIIEEMLTLIFREAIDTPPWYFEIATHTFITVLYYMIRYQKIDNNTNSKRLILTNNVKENIRENYKSDLSLDKIAKFVGHSKNYLCKIFKEQTGMTINLYLNKVRIDKAAELLVNTNLDIAEIGVEVGYNNIYHFIKTFKKFIGTSPGNFRKHELSGNALVSPQVRAIATIPSQRTRSDV